MDDDFSDDLECYRVNPAGIANAFPPGLTPPQLLIDFAKWTADKPIGSIGGFDFAGEFIECAPVFDGAPLWRNLALFLQFGDGSSAGLWCGPNGDFEKPPIVLINSEGQHAILSAEFESFLARLAHNPYEDKGSWAELQPDVATFTRRPIWIAVRKSLRS